MIFSGFPFLSNKKPVYASINKFCEVIEKYIKEQNEDSSLDRDAYEFYVIYDKDDIRPNKFDENYVIIKPLICSIYKHTQLRENELCNLFDCRHLYLKVKSKSGLFDINKLTTFKIQSKVFSDYHIITELQSLVIDREQKKFTNKEGIEICYHELKPDDCRCIIEDVFRRMNIIKD